MSAARKQRQTASYPASAKSASTRSRPPFRHRRAATFSTTTSRGPSRRMTSRMVCHSPLRAPFSIAAPTGRGDVLTRKSRREHVDGLDGGKIDSAEVTEVWCVRHVSGENRGRVRVDLAVPGNPATERGRDTGVEPGHARAQRSEHGSFGVDEPQQIGYGRHTVRHGAPRVPAARRSEAAFGSVQRWQAMVCRAATGRRYRASQLQQCTSVLTPATVRYARAHRRARRRDRDSVTSGPRRCGVQAICGARPRPRAR